MRKEEKLPDSLLLSGLAGEEKMRTVDHTGIVYNCFAWPCPSDEQRDKIKHTAQAILEAWDLYPESSLADLYDPLTMPSEMRKAHQMNDIAVMQAYGFNVKTTSESDCVAALMRMYQELIKANK